MRRDWTSSFRTVPVPTVVPRFAVPEVFTRFESVTVNVSSGSGVISPLIVTEISCVAGPPAAKVSVPLTAA